MVCLAWDPVVHPDLAGYFIYYSNVSGQYTDEGVRVLEPNTEVCIVDSDYFVEDVTYYFVATAYSIYDEESEYSNEVFTIWESE
jgi:hypothetical protein